ncbi:MAG TPA: hypothetical protein VIV14_09715, partial [Gammaproteobacteria bacterium]
LEAANGDEQAALEELRIAETLSRSDFAAPFVLATLAEGYGVIGLRDDARRILERIQAMGAQYSIGNASLGLAYLAADDEENALDWLTRAADYELPDEGVFLESTLWANVYADPVLEQPEFVEVRSRLGFRDL